MSKNRFCESVRQLFVFEGKNTDIESETGSLSLCENRKDVESAENI